jgi:23S rRNA-/tRNA-specific pseudouridylate synthase
LKIVEFQRKNQKNQKTTLKIAQTSESLHTTPTSTNRLIFPDRNPRGMQKYVYYPTLTLLNFPSRFLIFHPFSHFCSSQLHFPHITPSPKPKKDYKLALRVPTKHHQTRLDQFIHQALPTMTTKALSKMIKKKEILILKTHQLTKHSIKPTIITTIDQLPSYLLPNTTAPSASPTPHSQPPSSPPLSLPQLLQPVLPHQLISQHLNSTTPFPSTPVDVIPFLLTQPQQDLTPSIDPATSPPPNTALPLEILTESSRVGAGDIVVLPSWLCHIYADPSVQAIHKLISGSVLGKPNMLDKGIGDGDGDGKDRKLKISQKNDQNVEFSVQRAGNNLTNEGKIIISLLRDIESPKPLPTSFTEFALNLPNNSKLFQNSEQNDSPETTQTHPITQYLSNSSYLTPNFNSVLISLNETNSLNNSKNITPKMLPTPPTPPTPPKPPKMNKNFQQILTDVKKLQKITIYNDPYLFCINKPSGIAVHASDFQQRQKDNNGHLGGSKNAILSRNDHFDEDNNINMGSEHHIDAWLQSSYDLSHHYDYFYQLTNYIHRYYQCNTPRQNPHSPNQPQDYPPINNIPYSLSEIKSLISISQEGHQYNAYISDLINESPQKLKKSAENTSSTFSTPQPPQPTPQIPILSFLSLDQPRLVHRLDKATSGALTIAKSRLIAKTLGSMFHSLSVGTQPAEMNKRDGNQGDYDGEIKGGVGMEKLLHKVYLALVLTHPLKATKYLIDHENDETSTNDGLHRGNIVLNQKDLTFPNLFCNDGGFDKSGENNKNNNSKLLKASQSASQYNPYLYPLLSARQLDDDDDDDDDKIDLLTGNYIKKHANISKKHQTLDIPKNHTHKTISFPTARYIPLSTTQLRISNPLLKKTPRKSPLPSTPSYKQSVSLYKTLFSNQYAQLMAFTPVTGHFHQIRIHSAGFEGLQAPIMGEDKYILDEVFGTSMSHEIVQNVKGFGSGGELNMLNEKNNNNTILPPHLLGALYNGAYKIPPSYLTPAQGMESRNRALISMGINQEYNLERYYKTLMRKINQKIDLKNGKNGVNNKELFLVSHSLSFPHPVVLSHFIKAHDEINNTTKMLINSSSFPELMPRDHIENTLANQWLQYIAPNLFPFFTFNQNGASGKTGLMEKDQSQTDVPMMTFTCDLPPWFKRGTRAIGVEIM